VKATDARADRATRRRQAAADRALCPIPVAQVLHLRVAVVAEAMRQAGVTTPPTVRQAKAWRAMADEPPAWMVAVLADTAAHRARKEHRRQQRDIEERHRMLLLTEKVERRLLAGGRIRGADAEFIATDMAVRGMKELVRCDGDVGWLLPLDLAALRWAGVDPADTETWFLRRSVPRATRADEHPETHEK
jgi:hypothetical protein